SSRRRHTRWPRDWSSDVCPSDLIEIPVRGHVGPPHVTADWNLDGKNDDRRDPGILSAHYAGHLAEWNRLRELAPKLLLVGNTDRSEERRVGQERRPRWWRRA